MSNTNLQSIDYAWDFFLAHAGPDTATAELLHDLLIPNAHVFLDSKCLDLGDDWDRKLADAQRVSRVTVVLVSLGTDNAYYQREEIATAIAMARHDDEKHRVVPVYLDPWFNDTDNRPYGLQLKHSLSLSPTMGLPEIAHQLISLLARLKHGPISSRSSKPTQSLQILFKARPLDGYMIRKLDQTNQDWFEQGCKFSITLQNVCHEQVIIDSVRLLLEEYQPLKGVPAQNPRVDIMKFGDAVVPHQLFIELYPYSWEGWWVITTANSREPKKFAPRSTNLLEAQDGQSIAFVIKPGNLELITGSILAKERGLYKVAFCFEYSSLRCENKTLTTAILPILSYKMER